MLWLGVAAPGVAAVPTQLIRPDARWRYQTLPHVLSDRWSGWETAGFDDSAWPAGPAAFSSGYSSYQQGATDLPAWTADGYLRGLLLRHEFVLEDPAGVVSLALRLEYEDGVVVWLNGVEAVRIGVPPGSPGVGGTPPAYHPAGEAELIDLTAQLAGLRKGTNLLALQVLDASATGSTLFAWPELRANFTRGPIVQNVSDGAATVVWQCLEAVTGRVETRPVGESEWRRLPTVSPAPRQAVVMGGLEPGTAYEYRVVREGPGREVTSEQSVFRTLRTSGDLDFVVVGDTGASTVAHYEIATAIAAERTDLVLHLGDIVYPSFTPGRVDLRCFSVQEAGFRTQPWFFTFGNHDIYSGEAPFLDSFALPRNPQTGTSHYYSFDHGDAHFVCLFVPGWWYSQLGVVGADGTRSAQYQWLTNDLVRTTKPWKIVFFHQPMRSSGPHGAQDRDLDGVLEVPQIREALLPVLTRHGVQLVLNGHDHDWERFAPTDGLHCVVSGGGGAFLYQPVERDAASAQFVSRSHFARVRIRGVDLAVEAVTPGGEVFDRFSIRRASGPGDPVQVDAPWHSMALPAPGVTNGDGNWLGELFDLPGEGRAGVSTGQANLGRLHAAVDEQGIHVGWRDLMLWPDQTLAVFVAHAGPGGVSGLLGVGKARNHPLGALPIEFAGARPSLVLLLGDELADGTWPEFARPSTSTSPALGQGAFRLDEDLLPVPAIRLRQFNRSPEVGGVAGEQNADFVRVTLPWLALPGSGPGDILGVAAVVLQPQLVGGLPVLAIDAGFLATERHDGPGGQIRLGMIPLRLVGSTEGVDPDLDGLTSAEELEGGTDPYRADTDSDGLPDGWEGRHGLDARDASGTQGELGDPDGDGYTNAEEYASGTDPSVAATGWELSARPVAGGVEIGWPAMVGRRYAIERAEGLQAGFREMAWPGFPRRAASPKETVVLPRPGEAAWFRVREVR